MSRRTTPSEFFYRSLVAPSGCWMWAGATDPGGYGVVRFHGKAYKAHRLAWTLYVGPIGNGMKVLHRCDTPPCINPHHLFVGTQDENMKDCARKGRIVAVSKPGESNPAAKFTDAQVRGVREQYANGVKQHVLADQFGMSRMTVSRIVRGELRKGV